MKSKSWRKHYLSSFPHPRMKFNKFITCRLPKKSELWPINQKLKSPIKSLQLSKVFQLKKTLSLPTRWWICFKHHWANLVNRRPYRTNCLKFTKIWKVKAAGSFQTHLTSPRCSSVATKIKDSQNNTWISKSPKRLTLRSGLWSTFLTSWFVVSASLSSKLKINSHTWP